MLCKVWNVSDKPNMQAEIIENVNSTDIYTLKAEKGSIAVMVNGALLRIGFINRLPAIRSFFEEGGDIIETLKANVLSCLAPYANGNGWINLQEARAVGLLGAVLEAKCWREWNKEQGDITVAELAAQKAAEEANQWREDLAQAEIDFKEGKYIDAFMFEGLLVKYDIWDNIAIKTKGWIRNKLVSLTSNTYKAYTKSQSIFVYIDQLKENMDEPC